MSFTQALLLLSVVCYFTNQALQIVSFWVTTDDRVVRRLIKSGNNFYRTARIERGISHYFLKKIGRHKARTAKC